MSDPHVNIVYDRAHLIPGLPEFLIPFAGAHEDEVFDLVIGKFAFAENGVEKLGSATEWHLEPKGWSHARSGRLAIAAGATGHATDFGGIRAFLGMIAADVFFRGAVAEKRR